jgi:hypothetical protein
MDRFAWNSVWKAESAGEFPVRVRRTGDSLGGSIKSREWDIEILGSDNHWHYFSTLYGCKPDEDVFRVLSSANLTLFDAGLTWVREGN